MLHHPISLHPPTCFKKLGDNRKVGMRDGVMQSCVTVGVCHIDYELQQLWGDDLKGSHVLCDRFWVSFFVARKPQPTVKHSGVRQFLQRH